MVLFVFLLFLSNMLLLAVLLLLAFLLLTEFLLLIASLLILLVYLKTGGFTYWIIECDILHYWTMAIGL